MARVNSNASSKSKSSIGRKEGLVDYTATSNNNRYNLRGHRTISAMANKMKDFLNGASSPAEPHSLAPPKGLSDEQGSIYHELAEVVKSRKESNIAPPQIVVITDLAKDLDDLVAMLVLSELHYLRIIELKGFVANLMPAEKRARFGRGALDLLGLQNIPIARGTEGSLEFFEEHEYEFKCDFMADKDVSENWYDLLPRLYKDAAKEDQEIKLLLISSLRDIHFFSRTCEDLLKKVTKEIVIQGGYFMDGDKLTATPNVANNKWDSISSRNFHTWMQDNDIHSTVFTKIAAYETPLTSDFFHELEETGHPIGRYLRGVQLMQDRKFWEAASSPDESKRFAKYMDTEWFLKEKSSWYDSHGPEDTKPVGDEIIPYLTKVIIYDAIAAVGTIGDDALKKLQVLRDVPNEDPKHRIYGIEASDKEPRNSGVHGDKMILVIKALIKGALLRTRVSPS
ncbi:hypothetical protein BP6252_05613 [Coleophoma cylindrospora]|uniref:Inosine/uridine-preferring nucleoside hydrolase domain-containing protein n=1 Tax=Coleophoma cylindrospora TaxID=1849047 RepID=A0A3D8RUC7_9HELO|nr:hypothetical protein BP6252_05613 [Coleophoma cylindrospora]